MTFSEKMDAMTPLERRLFVADTIGFPADCIEIYRYEGRVYVNPSVGLSYQAAKALRDIVRKSKFNVGKGLRRPALTKRKTLIG